MSKKTDLYKVIMDYGIERFEEGRKVGYEEGQHESTADGELLHEAVAKAYQEGRNHESAVYENLVSRLQKENKELREKLEAYRAKAPYAGAAVERMMQDLREKTGVTVDLPDGFIADERYREEYGGEIK